jgi:hypothetical protein
MTPVWVGEASSVGELAGSAEGAGRSGSWTVVSEAEIEDFELAVGRNFEVGGFEVAMDDTAFVGVVEGFGELVA